jgi:glycosyltransferase involved in cell wall biosynthesis
MPLTLLHVAYPLATVSEGTAGGAEQVLLMLDKALVESGHRSLVLAAAGSRVHGLLLPVQVPRGKLDEGSKWESRLSFRRALRRAIERYPVDLIHMHGVDFDEYLPDGDIPVVVSLHLPLCRYRREALRIRRPDMLFVGVSDTQGSTAPRDVEINRVIGNGVDLDQFEVSPRKGEYLLFAGRICPEKGLHLAMQAAERAGEKLLIAGRVFDYPEHREYFETTIRPRLDSRFRLLGSVGGNPKSRLLAGAKCLLLPSLAPETSSLVAMEALASGTPVIAWRSGALPEIVSEGRTGFLVSSVDEMVDAVARLGSERSMECRREAERRFSAKRMFAAYLDLYGKLTHKIRVGELQAA